MIDVYPDGSVTVDGKSVGDWLAEWLPAPATGCDHAARTDPRFSTTCRKCGRPCVDR